MRLRRRRTEQVHPAHSDRDDQGRLYDGDTVRPVGWPGWDAALAARPARPDRDAPTAQYPIVTPAMRMRGEGGGWR